MTTSSISHQAAIAAMAALAGCAGIESSVQHGLEGAGFVQPLATVDRVPKGSKRSAKDEAADEWVGVYRVAGDCKAVHVYRLKGRNDTEVYYATDCDDTIVHSSAALSDEWFTQVRSQDEAIAAAERDEQVRETALRMQAEQEAAKRAAAEKAEQDARTAQDARKKHAAQVATARRNHGYIQVSSEMKCIGRVPAATALAAGSLLELAMVGQCMAKSSHTMEVHGIVLNDSGAPRKDAKLTCSVFAKSGTALSSQTISIFELWGPRELKPVAFDLERPEQGMTVNCNVASFD